MKALSEGWFCERKGTGTRAHYQIATPQAAEVSYLVPDRVTGLQELEELRRISPGRHWNFVGPWIIAEPTANANTGGNQCSIFRVTSNSSSCSINDVSLSHGDGFGIILHMAADSIVNTWFRVSPLLYSSHQEASVKREIRLLPNLGLIPVRPVFC
jgi:hypothetical protein